MRSTSSRGHDLDRYAERPEFAIGRLAGRIALWLVLLSGAFGHSMSVHAQQPPPRAAQDEFVPVDQLPPDEKLPAAPLLIAAYSVAWVLVAAYLWSIWRRLARVEREMADVTRRVQQNSADRHPGTSGGSGRR